MAASLTQSRRERSRPSAAETGGTRIHTDAYDEAGQLAQISATTVAAANPIPPARSPRPRALTHREALRTCRSIPITPMCLRAAWTLPPTRLPGTPPRWYSRRSTLVTGCRDPPRCL